MAGYIMTLGPNEYISLFYSPQKSNRKKGMETSKAKGDAKAKQYALEKCIYEGIYSARCSETGAPFIGTLADYLGMKTGDNIFFFKDRTIYGIGELVNIAEVDCRYRVKPRTEGGESLIEVNDPISHPFVCTFKPKPYFFKSGVDMDEVLMFNPDIMKSLRFFSKRTFMKLDDFECDAIKNILVRKNEDCLTSFDADKHYAYSDLVHEKMAEKIKEDEDGYKLSIFDYISDGKVSSEYYIEGAIMNLLRNSTSRVIGKWDFIGRQYPASPPKPSEYEESMDLFGYRYVPGYRGAISKYIVIELKTGTINREHVQQTMKYVDWISREYSKGDYSMIEAYTVGYDKEENIEQQVAPITDRNYIIESHPVENRKWQDLRILSYRELLDELMELEQCEREKE